MECILPADNVTAKQGLSRYVSLKTSQLQC